MRNLPRHRDTETQRFGLVGTPGMAPGMREILQADVRAAEGGCGTPGVLPYTFVTPCRSAQIAPSLCLCGSAASRTTPTP
jgi:hypothetical protein